MDNNIAITLVSFFGKLDDLYKEVYIWRKLNTYFDIMYFCMAVYGDGEVGMDEVICCIVHIRQRGKYVNIL